jgi:hypothetical protein
MREAKGKRKAGDREASEKGDRDSNETINREAIGKQAGGELACETKREDDKGEAPARSKNAHSIYNIAHITVSLIVTCLGSSILTF